MSRNENETASAIVRLTAVGDICLADSAYCIGHGTRSMIDQLGVAVLGKRLRELLEPSDLRFANLESILSDVGASKLRLSTIEMRGDPRHVELLHAGGFDVVNVANNHIYQHGEDAYRDTVDRLETAGIAIIGQQMDDGPNVMSLTRCGQRVHFIGFSMRPEQYRIHDSQVPYALCLKEEIILEHVRSLASRIDGHIICSLHWGHEYLDTPSREQQTLARLLIDAGARAVIGHHPHVLQGIERYKNGIIVYSLGNFIFDLREPLTLDTIAVNIAFSMEGVVDHSVLPLRIDDTFFPYRPTAAAGRRIVERVETLSRALIDGPLPEARSLLPIEAARNRESSLFTYRHFARNLHRYHPLMAFQSVARALLRRLGLVHNP